jgi:protein SCO1
MSLELGTHYEVVTVSFDSAETPALAAERAAHYHALYRNTAKGPEHWRFLTGDEPNITQLMTQLGFSYQPDAGEFAHAAAIMILTPQGEISQYFTDINVSPWDVRLALIEASQGRIGSAIDHFLLFCFRFDRTKGKYSWAAWNVLRIGSVGSVLVLASIAFVYSRNRQVK